MSKEIWTFKYEPKSLKEMIVSEDVKKILESIIKDVPNILIYGKPGTGKGTFTNILLKETGYDYIKINASDENSIDDVRTKIKSFATSLGLTDKKIVYLNEADHLSPAAQAGLRDLMESVQKNTRFIFLANYPNKIIDPIKSRCQTITLDSPPKDQIIKFLFNILKKENITIKNKKGLADIIKNCYPDIRQMVNSIQLNSKNGEFDSIKIHSNSDIYQEIFNSIKFKDTENVRKILRSEMIDYIELFKFLYEKTDETESPGDWIINIGEYMYKDSFVSIKEINFMAFFIKMIKEGII